MDIALTVSNSGLSNSNCHSFINTRIISTPIGSMIASASESGICLFQFEDSKLLEKQFKKIKNLVLSENVFKVKRHLDVLEQQVSEYFNKNRKKFDIQLDLTGTTFQKTTWKQLTKIPYGITISYKQQAKSIHSPKSFRAIGAANGQNPVVILIPCHRIVASNGNLTGYSGGLWRKKILLEHEGCSV